MKEKKCKDCGVTKSINEFALVLLNKDFHRSFCKECEKLQNKEKKEKRRQRYLENRIEVIKKQKTYAQTKKGKEVQKKADKKYKEKNNERIKIKRKKKRTERRLEWERIKKEY